MTCFACSITPDGSAAYPVRSTNAASSKAILGREDSETSLIKLL